MSPHPTRATWTPSSLLEFYGGRDSSGWQHEVAGVHGKPSYGAFNVEQFNLCRQEVIEYQKVVITDSELRDCETEEAAHDRLEMLLNLTPRSGLFWIGGDLGYTNDPTELVVFQEMEIGERSLLKMILRLHLEHVAYPHIAQVIALLERYFTIIDAVRCAMLIREEGNLDPIGEETVSLKPVFTDPVFI